MQVLIDLRSYLSGVSIALSLGHDGSGQDQSLKSEKNVLEHVIKFFESYEGNWILDIPRSKRCWYDFRLMHRYGSKPFLPVNIKVTTSLNGRGEKRGDNACSVLAVGYVFTDIRGSYFHETRGAGKYKEVVMESFAYPEDLGRDYYFLVVNKWDTSEVVLNSLRSIVPVSVTDYGNLPFQVNWAENKAPRFSRSFEESYKVISDAIKNGLSASKRSIDKTYGSLINDLVSSARDDFFEY